MGILRNLRSVGGLRGPTRGGRRGRLSRAVNIADLRRLARRRLPRGVFDYVDGAAEDELTAARNVHAYEDLEFRPRVLRDVGTVDTSTTLLGDSIQFPLVLAPTGFTRIVDPAGELAVAREAAEHGIPYSLSTLSTRSIEEVRDVSNGTLWFQVYVWRDKGLVGELLQRAADAKYSAIVITVDTAVLGRRERDVRRGFTLPPKIGVGTLFDGIAHPRWTWDFINSEPIQFANVVGRAGKDGRDPVSLAGFINTQFDPALSWRDIAWFRERWSGRIVLKGIQTVEDARIAANEEIDAVAISNHGGRQLDSAPPAIEMVPAVTEALDHRMEVICDGGVRRGSDIVKALALGATAAMAGRAYLYGLGAAGQGGVGHALSHLHDGFRRTMALTGCSTVSDIDAALVKGVS